MEYNDIELLIIGILLNVVRLVRKNQGQQTRLLSLVLQSEGADANHEFWIHGLELFSNGAQLPIGGQIRCAQGHDWFWNDGYIYGNLYLQMVGKCPFKIKHRPGRQPTITLSKDTGHALSYEYTKIGEFEI